MSRFGLTAHRNDSCLSVQSALTEGYAGRTRPIQFVLPLETRLTPPHLNLYRHLIRLNGFLLFLALSTGSLFGQDDEDEGRGDAIVSEKDAVDLVEDSSVREAISRRPDLSFANITIDGEDSRRSLDSISADSVTSVEVMKAVTPDQDADSRGGSISLKTRPAYDQDRISTKIGLEAKYGSMEENWGRETELSIGGPINKKKTVGGRLSVQIEKDRDNEQYILKDWFRRNVDGESHIALKEMMLYDLNEWIDRNEVSAALDVKAGESLRFFWRGSYQDLEDSEYRPHFKYRFNKGTFTAIDSEGANIENAEIERGHHAYASETELLESSLGGEWTQGDLEANFKYTYQDESETPLYHSNFDFVMPGVDLRYDLDDRRFPQVEIENGLGFEDLERYAFEDVSLRERSISESDTIASANLKWKNVLGNENVSLRFGGKSRERDSSIDYQTTYYDTYSGPGAFTLERVRSEDVGIQILNGRYRLDTLTDGQKVNAFLQDNLDQFRYDERRSRERSDPSTYQVDERVDAFYGMVDFEVGKWRGILGLRQEETSISFRSNEVLLGPDTLDKDSDGDFEETVYLGTNPTEGSSQYDHVFSNAHFRYKWNERTTFIASYTNTIKRPLYGEVVPYRNVRLEDREIEEGNPGLSPTLYENLDVSMDVRVGSSGLVSIELFDRTIDDFIFSRESIVVGGVYDGFERQRQENGSSGSARGLSLTWNQPITFPILPDGLSLNANYNALDTEIEYPSRPGEALPLTRSPESEVKFALKYEKEKLFVQLKWDYETESIYRVASSPREDRYAGPSKGVDVSLSYKLQPKTRLYFEFQNATNEPLLDFYEGDPFYHRYYRIRPWTLNTGMKFEL